MPKSIQETRAANAAYAREYRRTHRKQLSAYRKKYRNENKEHINELQNQNHKRHAAQLGEERKHWSKERREKENARHRAYVDANREKINEYNKERAQREPDKSRQKQYNDTHKEERHQKYIEKQYGLSPDAYQAMWIEQDGTCAICANLLRPGKKTHVDHDHDTGFIRGLLCNKCNSALGLMEDNPCIVDLAAQYLHLAYEKQQGLLSMDTLAEPVIINLDNRLNLSGPWTSPPRAS